MDDTTVSYSSQQKELAFTEAHNYKTLQEYLKDYRLVLCKAEKELELLLGSTDEFHSATNKWRIGATTTGITNCFLELIQQLLYLKYTVLKIRLITIHYNSLTNSILQYRPIHKERYRIGGGVVHRFTQLLLRSTLPQLLLTTLMNRFINREKSFKVSLIHL